MFVHRTIIIRFLCSDSMSFCQIPFRMCYTFDLCYCGWGGDQLVLPGGSANYKTSRENCSGPFFSKVTLVQFLS